MFNTLILNKPIRKVPSHSQRYTQRLSAALLVKQVERVAFVKTMTLAVYIYIYIQEQKNIKFENKMLYWICNLVNFNFITIWEYHMKGM